MNKKVWGFIFFLLALIILSLPYFNLTGAIIGQNENIRNLFYIGALGFLIASVFLFLTRKSLDVIVIPSGTWEADIDRANKALSEKNRLGENGYFVISGYKGQGIREMREGQSYRIYKYLRGHGISPRNIRIEGKSHDSEENVLYTLKKMKDMEEKTGRRTPLEIAFVSSPTHLKRFEDFYNEAVKRGLVDKGDFKFHRIATEGFGEVSGYEESPFRKLIHGYKLRTITRYKKKGGGVKYVEKPDPFIDFLRSLDKLRRKGKKK